MSIESSIVFISGGYKILMLLLYYIVCRKIMWGVIIVTVHCWIHHCLGFTKYHHLCNWSFYYIFVTRDSDAKGIFWNEVNSTPDWQHVCTRRRLPLKRFVCQRARPTTAATDNSSCQPLRWQFETLPWLNRYVKCQFNHSDVSKNT